MYRLRSFLQNLRIKYCSPLEPQDPPQDPPKEPEPKKDPPQDPPKDPPKQDPPKEPESKKEPKEPPKEDDPFKILSNPLVKAEIEKRARLAAKAAREEAEQEARTAAERAKMEEADRLRAEKEDLLNKTKESGAKYEKAQRQAEMWRAIVDGKYAIQPDSSDYIEYQVEKALESKSFETVQEAVENVIKGSPFLLEAPKAPEVKEDPPKEEPEVTTAPAKKESQTPAQKKPAESVDTLSMSKAEFQKHLQEKHGVSSYR